MIPACSLACESSEVDSRERGRQKRQSESTAAKGKFTYEVCTEGVCQKADSADRFRECDSERGRGLNNAKM